LHHLATGLIESTEKQIEALTQLKIPHGRYRFCK